MRKGTGAMNKPLSTHTHRHRILIAEDHPTLRDSFVYFLRVKGYDVYPAENGAAAVDLYYRLNTEGVTIDLVITDIDMPKLTGDGLIAAIRKSDTRLPILVMTNSLSPEEIHRLLKDPYLDSIEKPFRLPLLLERAEALLTPLPAAAPSCTLTGYGSIEN